MIIGICGGTASGKTTFTQKLLQRIGSDYTVHLEHDSYYRNPEDLPPHLQGKNNFDHPDALDNDLFIQHLQMLREQRPVDQPIYDFSIHRRKAETYRVLPKPVIMVEGILIFATEKLRRMFDIRVYIDTDDDIRLARRMRRDIVERGRNPNSVLKQYFETVRPMHKQYVEPARQYADMIIRGDRDDQVGLARLSARINDCITRAQTTG